MDLQFIAQQLLANTQTVISAPISVAVQSDTVDIKAETAPDSQEKISFSEYRRRQQELNQLIESGIVMEEDGEIPSTVSDAVGASSDDDDDDISSSSDDEVIAMEDVMEDEDEDVVKHPPKTRNEVPLPPVEPLTVIRIPDHHPIMPIGQVHSITDCLVVVQSSLIHGETQALDAGSMLAFEDRHVLGAIYETFGPVQRPFYSIRFNTPNDIDTNRCYKGAVLCASPEYSTFILTAMLRAIKGSDASNLYDEELSDQEFSDDEKEQQAKQARKKRPTTGDHSRSFVARHQPVQSPQQQFQPQPMMYQQPMVQPMPMGHPMGQPMIHPMYYGYYQQQQQQQQPPYQYANVEAMQQHLSQLQQMMQPPYYYPPQQ
jgi:rRNA processing protein Gar1